MALNYTCSTNFTITLSRSHRYPHLPTFTCSPSPFSIPVFQPGVSTFNFNKPTKKKKVGAIMFAGSNNTIAADLCATAISGAIAVSVLRLWEETAKRGLFEQVFYLFVNLKILSFLMFFSLECYWNCTVLVFGFSIFSLPKSRKPDLGICLSFKGFTCVIDLDLL